MLSLDIWAVYLFGSISTKTGMIEGIDDESFFQYFNGFQISVFPIDFAGHRYNSTAATTQPVIVSPFVSGASVK